MNGVESTGNGERAHAGAFWCICGKGIELLEGASNNNLTRAIHVGWRKSMEFGFSDNSGCFASEHCAHAGGDQLCCGGHSSASQLHETHGILRRENTGDHSRSYFANGVAGNYIC
jgi:hypothetical protein